MSWDDPNKSYSSYPGMWPSGYDGSGGGGGGGEGLLPDGVHPASAGGEGVVTSASTPSGRPVDWATYEAAAAATAYHHQQHQQHQHHYPQAHAAAGPGGFEGGGDGTLASLIAGVGGMGVGTRGPAAPRGGPAGAHQYMAHQQLHSHHPHHYASGSGGGGGGPGAAGRYISGAGAGAPAQPTPGLRGGGYPLGPRQDGSGGPAAAGGGGGHYLRPGGGAGPGGGIVPGSRRPRAGLGVAGGGGGGVGGGPGGPGEVNYNKIITKKLASATHFYQVLDVIASSVHVFDEVNVATALHRLAKLQPPLGAAGPAQLFSSDPFQRLVGAASRLLPRFGAQAVSNTLWAFATLGYLPADDLLERIARHAAATMTTFRPQATSNTLWALAKLGYVPPRLTLDAAASQMTADMGSSVPQDISNSLWAFATMRHFPGGALMAAAAAQAAATAPRFKPQEMANTLWACATLGHDPGAGALDALSCQVASRVHLFRPQAVSNSLWALAKLGYNPGGAVLAPITAHIAGALPAFTPQELANTLWALAALEHWPGAALLDSAAAAAAARIDAFAPADVANTVSAYGRLAHAPPGGCLPRAVAGHLLRAWGRYRLADLASLVWSVALLGGLPAAGWAALLSRLAAVPPASFDEGDLVLLYGAFLMLGGRSRVPGDRADDTVALTAAAVVDDMDGGPLFNGAGAGAAPGSHAVTPAAAAVRAAAATAAAVASLTAAALACEDPPAQPSLALASGFPAPLADLGLRAWRASVEGAPRRCGDGSPGPAGGAADGTLLASVSAALTSMGIPHTTDGVTPCGLFRCDIAVAPDNKSGDGGVMYLDLDGPGAHAAGSRRLLGRTAALRAAMHTCGYSVRVVPYYEWAALDAVSSAAAPGGLGLLGGAGAAAAAAAARAGSAAPTSTATTTTPSTTLSGVREAYLAHVLSPAGAAAARGLPLPLDDEDGVAAGTVGGGVTAGELAGAAGLAAARNKAATAAAHAAALAGLGPGDLAFAGAGGGHPPAYHQQRPSHRALPDPAEDWQAALEAAVAAAAAAAAGQSPLHQPPADGWGGA